MRRWWLNTTVMVMLWSAAACTAAEPRQSSLDAVRDAPRPEGRGAQVAGAFYPADPAVLRHTVTQLLEQAPAPPFSSKPRLLIVPHAGYPYSGSVAAHAYKAVQGQRYDAVIVVGFTHRGRLPVGSSVDEAEAYTTPLGTIPVDQAVAAQLRQQPGMGFVEAAHASDEHSLEVQLPFLQVALGEFTLAPVLMSGEGSVRAAEQLGQALAQLAAQGDYLFVFSTDLSHYHPYETAQRIDQQTITAIRQETPQAVGRLFEAGVLEACGRGPILASVFLAARLGFPERQVLFAANSGDTAGDRSRVVGYVSLAVADAPPHPIAGAISREAGAALVTAARWTLEEQFGLPHTVAAPPLDRYPELQQARGLFVTLRKRGELRGCIGRIETDESLVQLIHPVTLDSALRDHRFVPVSQAEVSALEIEVSVLTPPQQAAPDAIVAGRDGVVLRRGNSGGVFLPQVWQDTGWTRQEFFEELSSQKAGLPRDAWRQADLYAFQDQIFTEH